MRTENEHVTHFSPLQVLYDLAQGKKEALDQVSEAFLCEYLALFLGITGKGGKHLKRKEVFQMKDGREAAIAPLDTAGRLCLQHPQALPPVQDRLRQGPAARAKGPQERHPPVLRGRGKGLAGSPLAPAPHRQGPGHDPGPREAREGRGQRPHERRENNIPVEITPYYLSLFRKEGRSDYDRAIRAQVIPSTLYCEQVAESRRKGIDLDFMGRSPRAPSTASPAATRRS
jgi:lysine 2,3-aminomutase